MIDTLSRINEIIKSFEERRLLKVTKEETSTISKIPFKLISLRELYQCRITELSKAAFDLYKKDAYVPAFVLIRAVMETVAMFYVCYKKVLETCNTIDIGKLDDFFMQALCGTRDGTGTVKHYNALTAINHVGKKSRAFEDLYNSLCEFTHPNWAGVSLPYGYSEVEDCLHLLPMIDSEMAELTGAKPLMASLMLFDELYEEINKIYPTFLNVCEQNM